MSNQGQSRATIDKQRCIASALSIGLQIADSFASKQAWGRFNFWHFDANAGCGWNNSVDVPGSPIVFHAMADEYLSHMQRQAFFCDINDAALHDLQNRLARNRSHLENSFLFHGDNEEALEVFAERIAACERKPEKAIGCVIVDPNQYWNRNSKGEGPPVRSVQGFSRRFPKIDLVLNLNTRLYKLAKAHPWGNSWPCPRDVLAGLNKKHWLVKRTQVGGNEFLLAVGRNTETGDHRRIGLHKLESLDGEEIISRVAGSRQGKLFDAPPLRELPGVSEASDLSSRASGGSAASEVSL